MDKFKQLFYHLSNHVRLSNDIFTLATQTKSDETVSQVTGLVAVARTKVAKAVVRYRKGKTTDADFSAILQGFPQRIQIIRNLLKNYEETSKTVNYNKEVRDKGAAVITNFQTLQRILAER